MRLFLPLLIAGVLTASAVAQQSTENKDQNQPTKAQQQKKKEKQPQQKPEESSAKAPEAKPTEPAPQPEPKPTDAKDQKEEHFDMTEVAPVVTHHQITLDGKTLKYTA